MKPGDKCKIIEVTRFDLGRGFRKGHTVIVDHVRDDWKMVDCITEEGISHPFHQSQLQKISILERFLDAIHL